MLRNIIPQSFTNITAQCREAYAAEALRMELAWQCGADFMVHDELTFSGPNAEANAARYERNLAKLNKALAHPERYGPVEIRGGHVLPVTNR